MITSLVTSPRRGHRDAVTRLVTSRAAGGPCRAGPCPGTRTDGLSDARLRVRPERPMGGARARPSEAAEGLKIRKLIQSAEHESVAH